MKNFDFPPTVGWRNAQQWRDEQVRAERSARKVAEEEEEKEEKEEKKEKRKDKSGFSFPSFLLPFRTFFSRLGFLNSTDPGG